MLDDAPRPAALGRVVVARAPGVEQLTRPVVADDPAHHDRQAQTQDEPSGDHLHLVVALVGHRRRGDHHRIDDRSGKHERHPGRRVHAAKDEPPRHRHRPALAHREGKRSRHGARHLEACRKPGEAREGAIRDDDFEQRRHERAQQHERQRLDDDRREHHDEVLGHRRVAHAGQPSQEQ
jgi:hypothetical protein